MPDRAAPESPVTRALARLDAAGVRYEIVEHALGYSAADEADAAGRGPQETAKTLVLIDRDRVRLAVIPASRRLDLERARRARCGPAPAPRHRARGRGPLPGL